MCVRRPRMALDCCDGTSLTTGGTALSPLSPQSPSPTTTSASNSLIVRSDDGGLGLHEGEDELDSNGARLMTRRMVHRVCRARGHFMTPSVNTSLYLQDLKFRRIENLQEFTSCRVLHLSNNCLTEVEGLAHLAGLQVLYLQTNDLRSVAGLSALTALHTLNLSNNPGLALTGPGWLAGLPPSLRNLHVANTGLTGAASLAGLSTAALPALEVLDLSANPGLGGRAVLDVLCGLRPLRVLYLLKTPLQQVPNLRRILVSALPRLSYLDAAPVDECDRRGCEAWLLGGVAAEKAARLGFWAERRLAQKRATVTFAVERARRRALREMGSAGNDAATLELILEDTDDIVRRRMMAGAPAAVQAAAAAAAAAAREGGTGPLGGGPVLAAAVVDCLPLARYTGSVAKAALRHEGEAEAGQGGEEVEGLEEEEEEAEGLEEGQEQRGVGEEAVALDCQEATLEPAAAAARAAAEEVSRVSRVEWSRREAASASPLTWVDGRVDGPGVAPRLGPDWRSDGDGDGAAGGPGAADSPSPSQPSAPETQPQPQREPAGLSRACSAPPSTGPSPSAEAASHPPAPAESDPMEGAAKTPAEAEPATAAHGGPELGRPAVEPSAGSSAWGDGGGEGRGDAAVATEGGVACAAPNTTTASLQQLQPQQLQPGSVGGVGAGVGRPTVSWHVTGLSECVVCSEAFVEEEAVALLPCHHFFHDRCIRRWLLGFSNSCPMCRSPVRPQTQHASAAEAAEAAAASAAAAAAVMGAARAAAAEAAAAEVPRTESTSAVDGCVPAGERVPGPTGAADVPALLTAASATRAMAAPALRRVVGAAAAAAAGGAATIAAIASAAAAAPPEASPSSTYRDATEQRTGFVGSGGVGAAAGAADGAASSDDEGGTDSDGTSDDNASKSDADDGGRAGGAVSDPAIAAGERSAAAAALWSAAVAASSTGGTHSLPTAAKGAVGRERGADGAVDAVDADAATVTAARGFMSRYSYRAPLPVPRGDVDVYEDGCWEIPQGTVAAMPYL